MNLEQAKKNLEFADHLEFNVPDEKFDMNDWCGTTACIAGHYAWWIGKEYGEDGFLADEIAESMGLEPFDVDSDSDQLFTWTYDVKTDLSQVTRQMASNKLREIVYSYHPELKGEQK